MIYPNIETVGFCYWMLNVSWQRLTPPRQNLIELVYDAALNSTSVTDTEWNNFTQVTAWRYPYYLVYKNLADTYCSELIQWLYFLPSQPSDSTIAKYNIFFKELISIGAFYKMDRLYVLASEHKDNAYVSLVNPSSTIISLIGSPSWVQYQGFTGNASSTGLNTNFNPSGLTNYKLNSASLGIYCRTSPGSTVEADIGARSSSLASQATIRPLSGGSIALRVNNNTVSFGSVSTAIGLTVGVASDNNQQYSWRNGSLIQTQTASPVALPNLSMFICGYNFDGSIVSSDRQISLAYFGSGGINQILLNQAIQNFRASIGF